MRWGGVGGASASIRLACLLFAMRRGTRKRIRAITATAPTAPPAAAAAAVLCLASAGALVVPTADTVVVATACEEDDDNAVVVTPAEDAVVLPAVENVVAVAVVLALSGVLVDKPGGEVTCVGGVVDAVCGLTLCSTR